MRRLALALLLVLAVGCGRDAATTAGPRPTVLAAASLTEAFNDIGGATFTFAGSSALVSQIEAGAPADVFASADEKNMQQLVDAGLVEAPEVFAHNTLEIVTKPGNPKHIEGLADLADPDLAVVLADPSVPVGAYSQQVLTKAGVTVEPRSLELDVKAALTRVTIGDADAAIVYASDAQAAGAKATGVEIPTGQNVTATYPIAVVKASRHRAAARAFVRAVLSTRGQAALKAHGFLPA
ncbi:MAG: molybdenum transporter, periplasmic molybdate-binding protein [Actinomycetia bacterium]|nr:molybdenum transporter, periplasmic molybdate-binding protein [Actinomycetes bacterium]